MGFGKAFALALIIYIALNFVFGMLVYLLGAGIDQYFNLLTSDPMYFIYSLFAPIIVLPGLIWSTGIVGLISDVMSGGTNMLTLLMALLAGLVPGLLAAIIAGRTAESKGAAFGAWLLTAIISAVVALVFVGFLKTDSAQLQLIWLGLSLLYGDDILIYIALILSGLVNGIFYGAFAAVSASEGF
jgi:hypothetical protein